MRSFSLLVPLIAAQTQNPSVSYDAVPFEVRVPYQAGDCVRAVKDIDYEDLHGSQKIVKQNDKGTLVHVAPDHVVVKWNNQETLARAAAFPHQVKRQVWPKGRIGLIAEPSSDDTPAVAQQCLTIVEFHGFPPSVMPMDCVDNWQNQQFTAPLACRAGPVYWKKDPNLCLDAVHPQMVQLRECNHLESQIFALSETKQESASDNEGFLVGTGSTEDMCFKVEGKSLQFAKCDKTTQPQIFQFPDFAVVS